MTIGYFFNKTLAIYTGDKLMWFEVWLGRFPVSQQQWELVGVGHTSVDLGVVAGWGERVSQETWMAHYWIPGELWKLRGKKEEDRVTSEETNGEGRVITGDPGALCYQ